MKMRPLNLYWNGQRNDNFSTASKEGREAALAAGYKFQRTEGWILAEQPPLPQLNPREFKLYYHAQRGDNFALAAAESEAAVKGAGYSHVRNEGWIFTGQRPPAPNELVLESFWNAQRADNMTCATDASKQAALGAGYAKNRAEGFVSKPEMPGGTVGPWLLYHHDRGDNFTAMSAQSALAAAEAGYTFIESLPSPHHLVQGPGLVPMKLFYGSARHDHFMTATAEGENAALGAGYKLVRVEGYVYPGPPPGVKSQALKTWWNAQRGDNFLTFTEAQEKSAQAAGYGLIRVEGYLAIP